MSPVAQLIAMQERLAKHNAAVDRREWISATVREYLDMLQVEYDQRFMKVDGREG